MSGLEALGVAASIIQVADIGFQLSKNIYNYADTAASTDERLARIAKNVDLTTEVVSRVAEVFSEQEKGRKVVSQQALRLGRDVAVECEEVFGRLMGEVGKLQQNSRRYYKFPFKESKLVLWEAQLEKLKSTLNCLMNVLILAEALKERKDPSQRAEVEQLIRERNEAAKKYETLRKELEGAADGPGSSSISQVQTTVPPPRYDQIDTSRAPEDGQQVTPPMQYLDDCIPKVRAMLDTINDVQRSLGGQSRDYVEESEIRNLWSVYWSMNDRMTDTLRKLESEHKGPKPAHFAERYTDNMETDTYTDTITISEPIVESRTYTYNVPTTENHTVFVEETSAKPKRKQRRQRPLTSVEESMPAFVIPESRSWEPPMEFPQGEEEEGETDVSYSLPAAEQELPSPPSKPAEGSTTDAPKDDAVDELLREWTTVYD